MLDMPLFTGGWAASCVPLHVSACHLSPNVAHCMSLVPQRGTCHGTQQGVPTSLNTRTQTKPAGCQQILRNKASYYACEPTQGYGNTLSDPVSRTWEHYLSGPFSRLWETASLSYPDTCLRLPYMQPQARECLKPPEAGRSKEGFLASRISLVLSNPVVVICYAATANWNTSVYTYMCEYSYM